MNKQALSAGTLGGSLLGFFSSIMMGDVLKTILLAAIGATISFFVSLVLSRFFKK